MTEIKASKEAEKPRIVWPDQDRDAPESERQATLSRTEEDD